MLSRFFVTLENYFLLFCGTKNASEDSWIEGNLTATLRSLITIVSFRLEYEYEYETMKSKSRVRLSNFKPVTFPELSLFPVADQ